MTWPNQTDKSKTYVNAFDFSGAKKLNIASSAKSDEVRCINVNLQNPDSYFRIQYADFGRGMRNPLTRCWSHYGKEEDVASASGEYPA